MKIAYVIDNLGSGGAQRQAVELAVRLHRDAGVRTSFAIYREFDFFRARVEEAGVPIEVLPRRSSFDPRFLFRLRAFLASEQPDVVHAFLPMPTLWAALARGRRTGSRPAWIAAERSAPTENVGVVLARALRWAYPRFDAVTANSMPAADELVARFGMDRSQVHYLPNGIDLVEWDHRARAPSPIDLEPGAFHLALVGRVAVEKNHRCLVEALARLDPETRQRIRCWCVGARDGSAALIESIRTLIARYDLDRQVTMLPPTAELPALMAHLDGLVLPSRYEGFPNVVLEAMASRLPVIASSVGDVPNLLRDGSTGFVVPPDDVGALASALDRMVSMPAEARRRMGESARADVEGRFRIESIAERHLELYRRLADRLPRDAGTGAVG